MPQKKVPDDGSARIRRYQQIVSDLSRLASTAADLTDFLQQVVHHVGHAVDIDRIKVLRYRPERGDLLVEAGVGWKEGVVGKATLPIGLSSPPGRAIQTGQPTVIDDLPGSTEYRASSLLQEHGIVSLINAPIPAEGMTWGVLEADSGEQQQFSDDTVVFVQTVANLIGSAVQRKREAAVAAEAHAELARQAASRETLLREMQHRVKNNFQIIISMILIQQRRVSNQTAGDVLRDLADRVTAIALAHDQLDPGQGLRVVPVASYLASLCRQIDEFAETVTVETELEPSSAPVDIAVALGLIVNELVTNAMKHAFDGPGMVRVTFKAGVGLKESCLSVSDDGRGMGAEREGSSGSALVDALAAQLRGRVERESPGKGTVVRVHLPPTG